MKSLFSLLLSTLVLACTAEVVHLPPDQRDIDEPADSTDETRPIPEEVVLCEDAQQGDRCAPAAASCDGIDTECFTSTMECVDGSWEMIQHNLVCPELLPAVGEACSPQIHICVGPCQYGDVEAFCEDTSLGWQHRTL